MKQIHFFNSLIRARARARNRCQPAHVHHSPFLIVLFLLAYALGIPNSDANKFIGYSAQSDPPPPFPTPPGAGLSGPGAYTLDLYAGFARFQPAIKPGCWVPVWAELGARAAGLEGTLVLNQPGNPLRLEFSVQVGKGSRKRFCGAYRFISDLPSRLDAELRRQDFPGESYTIPLNFTDEGEQQILVLSDTPGRFGFLARPGIDLSLSTADTSATTHTLRQRAAMRRTQATPDGIGAVRVIDGDPGLLPEDPIALESLDGVLVNTARVRAVTPRQWDALRSWVLNGGHMLLAGGRFQPFIEQSVFKGAFGLSLKPAEAVAIPYIDNLPIPHPLPLTSKNNLPVAISNPHWDVLQSEIPNLQSAISNLQSNIPHSAFRIPHSSSPLLVSWPIGAWTFHALGDSSHPLIAGTPAGHGAFYLCAAALDPPFLRLVASRTSAVRLWPLLLERHAHPSPLEFLADRGESVINPDLHKPYRFDLVGPDWVCIYLASYLLVALPLAWFICGRLKRREWVWPAAVVLALAFTAFGALRGLRGQRGFFQANELTLAFQSAGDPLARAVTYSAFFSPRPYRTDLHLPPGLHPGMTSDEFYRNLYNRLHDSTGGRDLRLLQQSGATVLAGLLFPPWSLRSLRADFMLPAEGGVQAARPLTLDGAGKPRPGGCLVNRSPWDFKRWWLTNGRNYWRGVGILARGTSVTLAPDNFAVAVSGPEILYSRAGDPVAIPDPDAPPGKKRFYKESLKSLVGKAVESDILLPTVREMSSPSSDPQVTVSSSLRDWSPYSGYEPPPGKLYFIGLASGALSPLTGAIPLERRRGVFFYESELAAAPSAPASAARPIRWRPDLLDPQVKRNSNAYITFNRQTTNTQELAIEFTETDVQLIPDRPLPLDAAGSLTFAFRLNMVPNSDPLLISRADKDRLEIERTERVEQERRDILLANGRAIDPVTGLPLGSNNSAWGTQGGAIDPVTGMPIGPNEPKPRIDPNTGETITVTDADIAAYKRAALHPTPTPTPAPTPTPTPTPISTPTPTPTLRPQSAPPTLYKFAGCPVRVYNHRLHRWEPTRILTDGRHTVAPLDDYLDPGTSILALRIQADPEQLRLRLAVPAPTGEFKTGRELWSDKNGEIFGNGNGMMSGKGSVNDFNYHRYDETPYPQSFKTNEEQIKFQENESRKVIEHLVLTGVSVTFGGAMATTSSLSTLAPNSPNERRTP